MTVVGVVDRGAMGGRIAGRLLAAGRIVHGANRTASKARSLVQRGLIRRDSPREVAEQGRALQLPLTGAENANELLTTARAPGYGEQDLVAVYDVPARLAGHEGVAA